MVGVTVDDINIITDGLAVNQRAVDYQQAARLDAGFEFVEGRFVHGNDDIRLIHQRGGNRLIAHDDGAVSRAAAHFRPVGRQPGNVFPVLHAGQRKKLADQQRALPAEAGKNEFLLHFPSAPLSLYTPSG